MIKWTDSAIDAAWKAFWGDNHQIEKADMKAALDAAFMSQGNGLEKLEKFWWDGYRGGLEAAAKLADKECYTQTGTIIARHIREMKK